MRIFWVLALVLLATAPASVRAQQHGAPAPPREVGAFDEQARQLHAQFFVDPRIYAAEDGRRLVIGPFQAPGADAADVRVFDPAPAASWRSPAPRWIRSAAPMASASSCANTGARSSGGAVTRWSLKCICATTCATSPSECATAAFP